ncbi:LPXTG-motif cell wall-anchored protein [Isoptericola variabilis J7]|uniref:LPXTG-motif cell wall anchor domain protein n=1 Tax=Isoptericola variabilis (strain 225) TaxID=743718 RepID=F6FPH3_ISOV2|nr:LPXTG-motif cell wall anchor domain protein [Isoptericola variabilis 225]TWH27367.1 LPXTG-motif cell wall-anchored protein [Isoptericola variabilis J7]
MEDGPSDPRAEFVPGNATTCEQIGFGDSEELTSGGVRQDASDEFVVGTIEEYSGDVEEYAGADALNVTITEAGTAAGVVVDAVVVKGSDAYNLYTDAEVLPPALDPPQSYIAPIAGGSGAPADISHWFVCYSFTGSVTVDKVVELPDGPSVPIPDEFSITVTCTVGEGKDAEIVAEETFTFDSEGEPIGESTLDFIPLGAVCVVTEDQSGLPEGTVVTFDPEGADTVGVEITEAGQVVTVTVTNAIPEAPPAFVEVEKVVTGVPDDMELPHNTYVVILQCEDFEEPVAIEFMAAGGLSDPIEVTLGVECALIEDTTGLPENVEVSYDVEGAEFVVDDQGFVVFTPTSGVTAGITVTNDIDVTPSPSPSTPAPTTPAPSTPPKVPDLPKTGADFTLAWIALGALGLGSGALLISRRLRSMS